MNLRRSALQQNLLRPISPRPNVVVGAKMDKTHTRAKNPPRTKHHTKTMKSREAKR